MFDVGGNAPDVTACTGGNSSELLEFAIIGGRKGDGCIVRGLSSSSRKDKKKKKKKNKKKRKSQEADGFTGSHPNKPWVGENTRPKDHKKNNNKVVEVGVKYLPTRKLVDRTNYLTSSSTKRWSFTNDR